MERINFQAIEKKWQTKFKKKNYIQIKIQKNFTVLKCFLIHQVKFIWDM